MKSVNYFQSAYDASLCAFKQKRPVLMADLSGAEWNSPMLNLPYLNMNLAVNHETGEFLPDTLWHSEKICIYQYLSECCGMSTLSNRFISFLELPQGEHHHRPFIIEAEEPMTKRFGNNIDLFKKAGEALGGVMGKAGNASFTIKVFPKISLMFVLRAGDEEFPARGTILFDAGAALHMQTASLYMMGICVERRLEEMANRLEYWRCF